MNDPKPQKPFFIFEHYKGYIIASHRNNFPNRHPDNLFIFGPVKEFPENASVVRYDGTQPFGRPETRLYNIEDIKAYIDRTLEIQKTRETPPVVSEKPSALDTAFQALLDKRIKKGQLPTVSIAGHTFYADARIDLLRPKDDFRTMGIKFSEIDSFFDEQEGTYLIPYNPKTHEFQEPDYKSITEYPKELIAIRFPHENTLDPVGWNRRHGLKETTGIAPNDFKLHFKAQVVPWNTTVLKDIITENRKRLKQQEQVKNVHKVRNKPGRKM